MIWRWIAGGLALALGAMAIALWQGGRAEAGDSPVAGAPVGQSAQGIMQPRAKAPVASDQAREERRFNRYDKDRDETVTRDEYLASRKKAFVRLDTNGDGRLSFDEWAIRTTTKFGTADANHDGKLSRPEFATTAIKRKPVKKPKCVPEKSSEEDNG